ncbi:MAG: hypothetical protein AAF799_43945 [Myxococcota bacterium]
MAKPLRCPSCGAPLRWKGVATVVECRYCQTHVTTETGAKTEDAAVARTQMRPRNQAGLLAIVFAPVVVGVAANVADMSVSGVFKPSFEVVEAITLDQTEAQIATALDTEDEEDERIVFYFDHPVLDYVLFEWDDDHPEHVASFALYAFETNDQLAPIVERIGKALGERFIEDKKNDSWTWRWADAHIYINKEMTVLSYHSDPEDDPEWAERTDLMWSLFLSATAGRDLDVPAEKVARFTGAGVSLARLAQLDVGVEVDQATKEVRTRFPVATVDQGHDLEFELPVAHPWFGHIELEWRNAANGKMDGARLWPPLGKQEFADQAAMKTCLEREFGTPETIVNDHLKQEHTYVWSPDDMGALRLYDHILSLDPSSDHGSNYTSPRSKAAWSRVLSTLGACGG